MELTDIPSATGGAEYDLAVLTHSADPLQVELVTRAKMSGGGGPREVDTGVKSLSSDLHHNLKIMLKIKR